MLCQKHQVALKKNPSYQPGDKTITLQICSGHEEVSGVLEEFKENTGCTIILA
ncbi:MAG: hypothetical protein WCD89_05520 [Anaerocolumna sp.]